MPYFSVEFGLDQGYAHIIENDDSFPDHFDASVDRVLPFAAFELMFAKARMGLGRCKTYVNYEF